MRTITAITLATMLILSCATGVHAESKQPYNSVQGTSTIHTAEMKGNNQEELFSYSDCQAHYSFTAHLQSESTSSADLYASTVYSTIQVQIEPVNIILSAEGPLVIFGDENEPLVSGTLKTTTIYADKLYFVLINVKKMLTEDDILLSLTFFEPDKTTNPYYFSIGNYTLSAEDWIRLSGQKMGMTKEAFPVLDGEDNQKANRNNYSELASTQSYYNGSSSFIATRLTVTAITDHNQIILTAKPNYSGALSYFNDSNYVAGVSVDFISAQMQQGAGAHMYFAGYINPNTATNQNNSFGVSATQSAVYNILTTFDTFLDITYNLINIIIDAIHNTSTTSVYNWTANSFSFSFSSSIGLPTGFDTAGATGVAQMALDNSTYLGGYYNASAFTGYSVVRENINTGNTEYFSFIPPTASTSLYYYWH